MEKLETEEGGPRLTLLLRLDSSSVGSGRTPQVLGDLLPPASLEGPGLARA